jgi:HEAT repeat protein
MSDPVRTHSAEIAVMRKLFGVVALGLCLVVSAFAADIEDLVKQLKNGDNDARRAAAKALADAGGDAKAATSALVAALKDKDKFVRRFAAQALGEIGAEPREAVPGLKKALKDPQKEVQEAAATALGKMGPEAVAPLADVVKDGDCEPAVRRKAVEALAALGAKARPAVPTLLEALKGGGGGKKKMANPADIRTEVVIALGNIASSGDKQVISALEEMTGKKQKNRNLKQAANEALRKLQK